LFGKQILRLVDADSPARRVYFVLQISYVGTAEEQLAGLADERGLIAIFKIGTTSALAIEILDQAIMAAEADGCYLAVMLVRHIIRHEDAVLGRKFPAIVDD